MRHFIAKLHLNNVRQNTYTNQYSSQTWLGYSHRLWQTRRVRSPFRRPRGKSEFTFSGRHALWNIHSTHIFLHVTETASRLHSLHNTHQATAWIFDIFQRWQWYLSSRVILWNWHILSRSQIDLTQEDICLRLEKADDMALDKCTPVKWCQNMLFAMGVQL